MPAQAKTAKPAAQIAVIGIDIGKNVFHLIGLDKRGTIVLKCKLSRGQLESRLANLPSSLIGMEACVGAHHLSRRPLDRLSAGWPLAYLKSENIGGSVRQATPQ